MTDSSREARQEQNLGSATGSETPTPLSKPNYGEAIRDARAVGFWLGGESAPLDVIAAQERVEDALRRCSDELDRLQISGGVALSLLLPYQLLKYRERMELITEVQLA